MTRKIELVTNIAILLFVAVVGTIYIRDRYLPPKPPPEVKAGDQLTALPGYSWSSHPHTLVLAVRYGCHYCEDSAPFCKKLAQLETSGQLKDVHIIAVFPDDEIVARKTLELGGLSLDVRSSVSFAAFKIRGTPTAFWPIPPDTQSKCGSASCAVSTKTL